MGNVMFGRAIWLLKNRDRVIAVLLTSSSHI